MIFVLTLQYRTVFETLIPTTDYTNDCITKRKVRYATLPPYPCVLVHIGIRHGFEPQSLANLNLKPKQKITFPNRLKKTGKTTQC